MQSSHIQSSNRNTWTSNHQIVLTQKAPSFTEKEIWRICVTSHNNHSNKHYLLSSVLHVPSTCCHDLLVDAPVSFHLPLYVCVCVFLYLSGVEITWLPAPLVSHLWVTADYALGSSRLITSDLFKTPYRCTTATAVKEGTCVRQRGQIKVSGSKVRGKRVLVAIWTSLTPPCHSTLQSFPVLLWQ